MKYIEISKELYRIDFANGSIRLNLSPMNQGAADNNELTVRFTEVTRAGFLFAGDLVGIVGLQLDNCPAVPRICWDNREHQFWDGFQGSFETRNVVICSPTIGAKNNGANIEAGCYYIANLVKTSIAWNFYDSQSGITWDTEITIENLSGEVLRNYGQLFACYHRKCTNYYWDSDGNIRECSPESFNATGSISETERLKSTPYHDHLMRGLRKRDCQYVQYSQPVLMSEKQLWYNNGRHILFVEPDKCAAMVTWMNQARDYYLSPPGYDLKPKEPFKTRVRHMITTCNSVDELKSLWEQFEECLR